MKYTKKVRNMAVIGAILLVAGLVTAALLPYFVEHTTTVSAGPILKWDGSYVEGIQTTDDITLIQGSTVIVNHTLQYTGDLAYMPVVFTWSGCNETGVTCGAYINDVLTSDISLVKDELVTVQLRYACDWDFDTNGPWDIVFTVTSGE